MLCDLSHLHWAYCVVQGGEKVNEIVTVVCHHQRVQRADIQVHSIFHLTIPDIIKIM
jgi:hypothetical protein